MARTEITREEWQVEQLRCTAFLLPQTAVSAHEVFQVVVDSEPLSRTENRQPVMSSASGRLNHVNVDVVCMPGRIDVLFQPGQDAPPGPPVIGTYLESKHRFVELTHRWLRLHPPLQRLALGLVAVADVADRSEGYRLLQRLLPSIQIDADHSSDFSYQINRPRLANVADGFRIKINRLSRWSAIATMLQTIQIRGQDTVATQSALTRNRCRVELDLSSDEGASELPAQHVNALWGVLSGFADEILFEGDLP